MTSQINSKENKPKMSTSIQAQQKPSSTAATTPLTQKTLFSFFKSPATSSTNNTNASPSVSSSPTVQKTTRDNYSAKKRLTKNEYVEIDEEEQEEEEGGDLQFLTPTSQQSENLSTKNAISAASVPPFASIVTPLTPVTSDEKKAAESEAGSMDEYDEDMIRSNLRFVEIYTTICELMGSLEFGTYKDTQHCTVEPPQVQSPWCHIPAYTYRGFALSRLKKRIRYNESEDEEENNEAVDAASSSPLRTPTNSANVTPTQKRRKTLTRKSSRNGNDDDGDDDFNPAGENDKYDDDDDDELMNYVMDDYESKSKQDVTPKIPKLAPASFSFKPLQNNKIKHLASPTSAKRGGNFLDPKSLPASSVDKKKDRDKKFKEKNDERYAWLQDIRDAQDSPDYDPRTLYVPQNAWAHFTPFEKQFWEIKSQHWDTVVFFKKGKFYELYEKDADIGHREFDLKLTDRVNMRMVGVPESSFDHWATRFVANGHKIAKVVQMETAIGKSMREAKSGKEDKIIRRELSCVLTAGTLVDTGMLTAEMGTYCMSVKEYSPADHLPPSFGVVFVDTSTAEFHLVAFDDDLDRTKFETLVMQVKPREIVCEKSHLTQRTTRILKNNLVNPLWNALISEREFWDAATTKDEFRIAGYFDPKNDGKNNKEDEMDVDNERIHSGEESWPQAIQDALDKPLLMSALGGLTWYLRSLKLDTELLSLRNFHRYDPIRQTTSLVLDGQTLANLDILENSNDGTADGTLHQLLNHATTPFGKRLFRKWLCHPLRAKQEIDDRLDAVEDLMGCEDMQDLFRARFAHVPDLERVISRVHAGTCKVKDFLAVLAAFKTVLVSCQFAWCIE
ncbi:hypothetical protein BC937DRAFT_87471 [Endogone sp. FLAS-F59071]|nr:hypothetical protein BC937DRAFT_87471 [Endogone sp. FLAS-F59071]|eukprot:RUS19437.1 hypothetical protein BC937DRAFT_87471 [Endogone sp. FLAS-F59071]